MSLMKTKPRWCALAVAAENGWINGNTGELLVSFRGLKSKLEAEAALEVVETVLEVKEEIMKIEEPKEVEAVKEQTVKKPKKNQKLIAEVVEFKIDENQEVIGE